MAEGRPLNDADRQPWLAELRQLVDRYDKDDTAVLACSALGVRIAKPWALKRATFAAYC